MLDFSVEIRFYNYLMSSEEQTQSKTPLDLTWKDAEQLKRFTTDTGKILPRRYTRLNAKQQRHITRVIKQARNMLTMK